MSTAKSVTFTKCLGTKFFKTKILNVKIDKNFLFNCKQKYHIICFNLLFTRLQQLK